MREPPFPDSRHFRRKMALAWLALAWERLWPLAWPLPALAATFSALALFDVLPRLPGWLHAAILGALLLAFGWALWRLGGFSPPGRNEARHRLELDSGLPHRPLLGLEDKLAAGTDDPVARALWGAERARLAQALGRLSVRAPSPGLAAHDPWGLRFAGLLLLAVALSGGWHGAPGRFFRAVSPELHMGGPAPILQVWITPPAYTGMAPVLLQSLSKGQDVEVPAGSKLLAELQGGQGKAQLVVDDEVRPFDSLGSDSQRLETTLTRGKRLSVRQGRHRVGSWAMAVIQDHPPSIALASPPDHDPQGRLRLDVEAHDDYGVVKAWAVIRRVDDAAAAPMTVGLPLGGGHPKDVRQAAWHDLTGHPWAGLPVTIQPVAEDGAGQKGAGEPVSLTLPERNFTNPVARAIIEQRRHLVADPQNRDPVIDGLATIASSPHAYADDMVVFLSLSTARSRLMHDNGPHAVPSVLDMLWETALRIEEGDRPAAQRALEAVAKELQEALADNAPEAEIERLTNQLQAAMSQYLDALAQQAEREGAPPPFDDPNQQVVTPEELQDMLDRMRDMARTGSREAAQETLAQLRQMLQGLQNSTPSRATAEQARQAQQAMSDLQGIARDQQKLLDDTFRRNQSAAGSLGMEGQATTPGQGKAAGQGGGQGRPSPGRPGGNAGQGSPGAGQQPGGQSAAGAQEELRKRLGQVLQSLGDLGADIPNALGQAEGAMRDASRALGEGDLDQATDAQTEALARLQEGAQQAMQAMSRQMGGTVGRQGRAPGRDPLGRQLSGPGGMDENSVKIPDQADMQKAREVLDELRKRSGEAQRPPAERDYLQRLLKQFY